MVERDENEINMNRNKIRRSMWKFKTIVKKLKLNYMLEVMNIETGISKNSLLIKKINLRISSSM